MISWYDAQQRFANAGEALEVLDTSASAAYSKIIPPYTALRISGDDAHIVKICRELLFDGDLGRPASPVYPIVEPTDVWASDAEDALLAGRWDVSQIVTNTPTLDKTEGSIALSHVMEIALDDQDDEFGIVTSNGRRFTNFSDEGYGSKFKYERPKNLQAGALFDFVCDHIESTGTNGLQYQIREIRGHATVTVRYWDGSAWQNTVQWVDLTSSATLAQFVDAVTLDEASEVVVDGDGQYVSGPAYYEIWLRPESNHAADTSHVSSIGLCERVSATSLDFRVLASTSIDLVTGPYYSRVGAIADNASKKLYITRLGTSP